jgi:phosphoenolpyruvate carboxykinase (ATP)
MVKSTYGLEHHGLVNLGNEYWNLHAAPLTEMAIKRGEGFLAHNGALNVLTGKRTGRSPADKYVVDEPSVRDLIHWGKVNKPISQENFERLLHRVQGHFQGRDVFVFDGYVGAHEDHRLPIRIVNTYAWQNLFAHQLFLHPSKERLRFHKPEFVVLCAPDVHADPERDGTNSEAFIIISFERKIVLIGGTHYAGEIKKSVFSVMNYWLPLRKVLPMHCSANVGKDDDVAIFFGLSGTGKTSLSADPQRRLIGDDEHGWSDDGIFNFEGGCYAKCIRLSEKYEPQIYRAIRFGCVLENVVLDEETREPLYDDDSITENTRAAYPIRFIENAVLSGCAGHPKVILLLAADAFGVLPPIARLTPEQTMYHYLSGYTSKIAGTEVGMGQEPEATFDPCYGSPFLPLPHTVYAKLLGERMRQHNTCAYLVNTGWTGGPYGVGNRIRIDYTRIMVRAAIAGKLEENGMREDPFFGVQVPLHIPGIPDELLNPRETWADPLEYDRMARQLVDQFRKNFARFKDVPKEILEAGPRADC